jgi:hypothetical protein
MAKRRHPGKLKIPRKPGIVCSGAHWIKIDCDRAVNYNALNMNAHLGL